MGHRVRSRTETEGPLAEVLANFDLSSRDINLVQRVKKKKNLPVQRKPTGKLGLL